MSSINKGSGAEDVHKFRMAELVEGTICSETYMPIFFNYLSPIWILNCGILISKFHADLAHSGCECTKQRSDLTAKKHREFADCTRLTRMLHRMLNNPSSGKWWRDLSFSCFGNFSRHMANFFFQIPRYGTKGNCAGN